MNASTGGFVQAHPLDHATPQAAGSTTPRGPDDRILAPLLHSIARGDAQTFATFYDLTSARLYGSILRVVRSPDHAAEVTQDVYIEIWRTASQYDPARGSVMGWMSTMARRRAIDRVRSVSRSAKRDAAWAAHTH